jgi:hypothetical protein
MSTGSSKAICIIIYAIYKEIDLKMFVEKYQIRQISAFFMYGAHMETLSVPIK